MTPPDSQVNSHHPGCGMADPYTALDGGCPQSPTQGTLSCQQWKPTLSQKSQSSPTVLTLSLSHTHHLHWMFHVVIMC